jgi:hypothetical protein
MRIQPQRQGNVMPKQPGCMEKMVFFSQAVVSHAHKTLRVSTIATIAQILDISSKEGTVIGAVLSTQKFHRGHH